MSRILILGGAGYVGSALAPYLQEQHDITVIDKFWFGDYLNDSVTKIKKDVMDLTEDDFNGYDAVIFMAGLSNDPMSEFMPKDCFIQNGAAPVYCAYLAKRAGVPRYIYASTCSVYGFTPGVPRTEDSKIICNYPYGVSKYTGEAGIFALADDFFTVVALRKGTISGWSPRMRFDLLINTMYKNLVTKKEIMVSNPSLNRPMLAIMDALYAYENALELPSGVYNAVSYNTTLGALARDVSKWAQMNLGFTPKLSVNFIGDLRNYEARPNAQLMTCVPNDTFDILDDIHAHNQDYIVYSDPKYSNSETFKKLFNEGKL